MKPFNELTIAEAEDAWNNALANHSRLQESMGRVMDLLDEMVKNGHTDVNIVKVWLAIVGNKQNARNHVKFVTGYSDEELNNLGGFEEDNSYLNGKWDSGRYTQ